MKNHDENGFKRESSLVTIPRKQLEQLKAKEKELQQLKKLNQPPDVEYRKRGWFGRSGTDIYYKTPEKGQKPPIKPKERR